jgi:putrescine transport system substrate-binding protein
MIFDPDVVSKFTDCGVMVLDSPTEVLPAALKYLEIDPDSKSNRDVLRAANAIRAVRPYIRKFDSLEYIYALGDGDICLTFGFAGGIYQARERAIKAEKGPEIGYFTPKEGGLLWIDVAAMPSRAPNPDNAYRFLDYILEAKIAAVASEVTGYASANRAATALTPKRYLGDPMIFPPADVRAKFYTITPGDVVQAREIDRLWTAILRGR